ncbi:MAG: flavodoxin family protein [Chloroflexota bacterium]|nr:flavodoxin family protein [Chloroflexota bacterium]
MKVVAFNSSPRKEGNTALLVDRILDELSKEGIETESVHIGGKPIRGCMACFKCVQNQDKRCSVSTDILNECIEKMLASDGIILASPTYFADVTAELKALIDRSGMVAKANGDMFSRKVGAAVVVARRAGSIHAYDTINHYFLISQMIVPGANYWNMGLGMMPGDVAGDAEAIQTMTTLGKNMAWLMKKTHG